MKCMKYITLLWALAAGSANALPTIADLNGDYPPPTSFIKPLGSSGILWSYTTSQPASNWAQPSFSSTGWSTGYGGFYAGNPNPNEQNNTPFNGTVWLRGTVNLTSADIPQFMLWGRWDDKIEIYINGILAASRMEWTGAYEYIGLNAAGRNALSVGNNLIAVKVTDTGHPGYFNLAVVRNSKLANPPVNGFTKAKGLNWVTDYVKNTVTHDILPATTLAISKMRNGHMEVVYSAGFGYMDKQQTIPVKQDAVMRLASTDKTPTWVALRNMTLHDEGCDPGLGLSTQPTSLTAVNPHTEQYLKCTDKVFDIMVKLGVVTAGNPPDGINQITIEHLLRYRDFFTSRPNQEKPDEMDYYYAHLGISPSQTSTYELMRWYFTNPTKQVPGSDCIENGNITNCYNSDGAAVARYLIAELGGEDSVDAYLRNVLMANSHLKDIYVAYERVEGRQLYADGSLREPWYRTQKDPFPFWVGLEDALALSASAETLAATFPTFPYEHLTGGGGSMPGTRSHVVTVTSDADDNAIGVAWLSSGPSYISVSGERGTDQAFGVLKDILKILSASSWNLEQGRIKNVQTGFCIHPSGGDANPGDGTPAVIWNDCSNQSRLNFRYTSGFGIQHESSNKCLHPQGGSSDPAIGTPIVFWSGCDEQKLDFKIMLDGTLMHIPSGKCVVPDGTTNGAQLRIQSCSSASNKLFEFVNP